MLILELTNKECVEMLTRLRFGRLGCSRDNQPYIVPFNFAYRDRHLYSVAALGQKIEWMRTNPLVCVEADEIINYDHWTSVVVQGRYEELPDTPKWSAGRELAYALLQRRAMWWEPACVKEIHLGLYLNQPEATAEAIGPDGWFHTGKKEPTSPPRTSRISSRATRW